MCLLSHTKRAKTHRLTLFQETFAVDGEQHKKYVIRARARARACVCGVCVVCVWCACVCVCVCLVCVWCVFGVCVCVCCVYKLRDFEVLKLVVHTATTLLIFHHCVLTPSTRKFATPRLKAHARKVNRLIFNSNT
jgi:hypothetical protein